MPTPEQIKQHNRWKEAHARLNGSAGAGKTKLPEAEIVHLVAPTTDPTRDVMDFVIAAVGNAACLPVVDVLAGPPTFEVTQARNLAMALCALRCGFSIADIAVYFEVDPIVIRRAVNELRRILIELCISHRTPLEVTLPAIWPRWMERPGTSVFPSILSIQKSVCEVWGVRKIDLISSRRTGALVTPRHAAMALCRELTLKSMPEIARQFGGRDHTSVLHAVNKFKGIMANVRAGVSSKDSLVAWASAVKKEIETTPFS